MKIKIIALLFALIIFGCGSASTEEETTTIASDSLETTSEGSNQNTNSQGINLPEGFSIDVFAEVEGARSLAMSPSGVIYVGNRSGDKVHALKDTDGDWVADETYVIAEGLNVPNGVAFKDGDLYVAEISNILKFSQVESDLSNPPSAEVVYGDYPTDGHHGWKYIAFGPDGKLYVPVGAPCNICESEEIYASLTRMDPDGSNMEIIAHGIRNTVGFDWNPETGKLWFSDNGRDMMGDNIPPCELNKITEEGQHFGYPYCHGGTIGDPQFGSKRHCNEFRAPEYNFAAHTAPLGIEFYSGDMFPDEYNGDLFVAQHGSWNRSSKIGYRVMRVSIENGKATGAEVFIDGWLNHETQDQTGRPVDILQMPDGSLLVSDDYGHKIYRISYQG